MNGVLNRKYVTNLIPIPPFLRPFCYQKWWDENKDNRHPSYHQCMHSIRQPIHYTTQADLGSNVLV